MEHKEIFNFLDVDKNGYISFELIYEFFYEPPLENKIIYYTEFKQIVDRAITEQEYRKCFEFLDRDNSGSLSKKNLLECTALRMSEEDIEEILSNGEIDYVEFKKIIDS